MKQKIEKIYFEIFKQHYPDITVNDVTAYYEGNDHRVFVIGNKVTFRFPKVPREIDPKRANFLKKLVSISPLSLPTIEIHKDKETEIVYEINTFIPGESFHPNVAKTFSHDELMKVAQKLGAFLSAIHSFSIEEARKLQLDEMNPNDFWEFMEQNPTAYPSFEKSVFPHVTKEEQDWIKKLFTDYIALIKEEPFETKVTHSDMWTYHIIVNAENHTLSGVIDFWGRIADPANDFKAFEYYGKAFIEEVYRNYTLPRDKNFDKRRLFYTGHDEVFEYARQLKEGSPEKIEKQKQSLSNYIASHPFN